MGCLSLIGHIHHQQEELFSSTDSNRAVASNEDEAVELTMYRQNSSRSSTASVAPSGDQDLAETQVDELSPAERGEAPPLKDVKKKTRLSV